MSTLKITNIQATGETASRAVSGVAAAWVNFNGTGTIAVRDSVNVASLTDRSSGGYTVNYSNSFNSSTSFTPVASAHQTGVNYIMCPNTGVRTSGSNFIDTATTGYVSVDCDVIDQSIHGDLA
jgi:hypothetical protein